NLPAVLGMAAFIVLVKALATAVAVVPFRLGSKATVFTGLGMIQIGEFRYVLARAGREAGAVSEALNSLILTSSMVTILLTPIAFLAATPLARLLDRRPSIRRWLSGRSLDTGQADELAEHAIVVGYGRVGSRVVAGLRRVGLPLLVIEEDLHLVQRLTAAGVPAIYGDASQPLILRAAHPERARLLVVALPDAGATRVVVREARRMSEHLPILARAARLEEREVLGGFGATRVVAPELAGAALLLEASAHLLDLDPATLLDPEL